MSSLWDVEVIPSDEETGAAGELLTAGELTVDGSVAGGPQPSVSLPPAVVGYLSLGESERLRPQRRPFAMVFA